MGEILDKVLEVNPHETSLNTINIMMYELGDLTKMLFYTFKYPDRKKVNMIEAKIAMSDLLAQCHVICEREGWNFAIVDKLGKDRLMERINRYIEFGE